MFVRIDPPPPGDNEEAPPPPGARYYAEEGGNGWPRLVINAYCLLKGETKHYVLNVTRRDTPESWVEAAPIPEELLPEAIQVLYEKMHGGTTPCH